MVWFKSVYIVSNWFRATFKFYDLSFLFIFLLLNISTYSVYDLTKIIPVMAYPDDTEMLVGWTRYYYYVAVMFGDRQKFYYGFNMVEAELNTFNVNSSLS